MTDVVTPAEAEGLARIRRLRNWMWGWPVAGVALFWVAGSLLGEKSVFVFFGWAAAFFAIVVRHLRARCPRCHQHFNVSEKRRHHVAAACTHCGLKLERPY